MAVSAFFPVALLASAHIAAITAYHYVSSPILGFIAFVLAILDLYFLFAKGFR